jgi:hypothetical protein
VWAAEFLLARNINRIYPTDIPPERELERVQWLLGHSQVDNAWDRLGDLDGSVASFRRRRVNSSLSVIYAANA